MPLTKGAFGHEWHENEVLDISNTEFSRYSRSKMPIGIYKMALVCRSKILFYLLDTQICFEINPNVPGAYRISYVLEIPTFRIWPPQGGFGFEHRADMRMQRLAMDMRASCWSCE